MRVYSQELNAINEKVRRLARIQARRWRLRINRSAVSSPKASRVLRLARIQARRWRLCGPSGLLRVRQKLFFALLTFTTPFRVRCILRILDSLRAG